MGELTRRIKRNVNRHRALPLRQRLDPEIRVVAPKPDQRAVVRTDQLFVPHWGEDFAVEDAQCGEVSGGCPEEDVVYGHAVSS